MPKRTVDHRFWIDRFYSAFRFSWDDSFVFMGESHNFWEAVFVTEGEVEVTENENVYTLGENCLILHAPMEFHRIKSKKGSSPKGIILSFGTVGELPRGLDRGVFMLEEGAAERYRFACDHLISFMEDETSETGQEAADLLSAFLIRLSASTQAHEQPVSAAAQEYCRLVTAMTAQAGENLNLSDFAAQQHISISYIKYLFHKYAGVSPKAYYTQLRVFQATKLLREGATVAEVADRMNFSSACYFSAFYKKQTGMLPSSLKNNSTKEERLLR